MVIFNELRICDDGNKLIIDVSIDSASVYDNMYIKGISVIWYKDMSASASLSSGDIVYQNTVPDITVRNKRLTVNANELLHVLQTNNNSFKGGLVYVLVECDGTLPASISTYPCGADEKIKIAAAPDWKTVYSMGMGYVYDLFDDCSKQCKSMGGFENFVLLWNALKLAIAACDWDTVSSIWDKLNFVPSASGVVSSGCGCR